MHLTLGLTRSELIDSIHPHIRRSVRETSPTVAEILAEPYDEDDEDILSYKDDIGMDDDS